MEMNNFYRILREKDLSVKKVAEMVQRTPMTVYAVAGNYNTCEDTRQRIADAVGVKVSVLFAKKPRTSLEKGVWELENKKKKRTKCTKF